MYDLFKPMSSLYPENGLTDKPVMYSEDFLKKVIEGVDTLDLTEEHTDSVVGTVSNFVFVDGVLKCDVSDNVDMSNYGLSPQFQAELVDAGDYLQPVNAKLTSVGLTKTPRTHILNNNEGISMSDEILQQTMKRNTELEKEMAQKDNELESLKQKLAETEKLQEKYAKLEKENTKNVAKLEELSPKAEKFDAYSANKREELLTELAGESDEIRNKYESFDLQQLEIIAETRVVTQKQKGVDSHKASGDNKLPEKKDNDDNGFDREKFANMYKEITGEDPKYI